MSNQLTDQESQMSNTATTSTPEEQEQSAPPAPEGEQQEQQTESTEEQPNEGGTEGEGEGSKLSHEDALKELARVRQEAASRRTELREVQAQLANAKTPEEFAAVTETVNTLSKQILVRDVADEFGLPKDLREVLKGDTEEELKAHAEVLKRYIPKTVAPPPPSLGGGLDPSDTDDDEDSLDPKALASKVRSRTRF